MTEIRLREVKCCCLECSTCICSTLSLNWLWACLRLPALEEARDICTYLRPLQRLFEDMENVEFPDVRGQIGPLMHTVCLVWANSRYYNTPARLIVLLQETCNLLIQQVSCTDFSLPSASPILRVAFFFIFVAKLSFVCTIYKVNLSEITYQFKEVKVFIVKCTVKSWFLCTVKFFHCFRLQMQLCNNNKKSGHTNKVSKNSKNNTQRIK